MPTDRRQDYGSYLAEVQQARTEATKQRVLSPAPLLKDGDLPDPYRRLKISMEPAVRPTLKEAVGAYMYEKYWPANLAKWIAKKGIDNTPDPDFDLYEFTREHMNELGTPFMRRFMMGRYDEVANEEAMWAHLEYDRLSDEANDTIGRASLSVGLAGGLATGIFDPLNIALGVGGPMVLLRSAATSAGVVGKIGRAYYLTRGGFIGTELVGGAVVTAAGEAVNVATNPDYDIEEAIQVFAASTVLNASIQGAIGLAFVRGRQRLLLGEVLDAADDVDGSGRALHMVERAHRGTETAEQVKARISQSIDDVEAHGRWAAQKLREEMPDGPERTAAIDNVNRTVREEVDKLQLEQEVALRGIEHRRAMGAAAAGEFDLYARLREDTLLATPKDVDDAAMKGRGAMAGATEKVSNVYRNAVRGHRFSGGASTRLSPNAGVRGIAPYIEDVFVPTKGHIDGGIAYSGESMARAMRNINSWKQQALESHGHLVDSVAAILGTGDKLRHRIASRLGVREAQRTAVDTVTRTRRLSVRLEAIERRLLDPTLKDSEGWAQLAAGIRRRLDAEYERLGIDAKQRKEIDALYKAQGEDLHTTAAGKLHVTDTAEAIERAFQPNKDLVVVQYDPNRIGTAADLDAAVEAVHGSRSYANKRPNSLDRRGDFWGAVDEDGNPVVRNSEWFRANRGLDANDPAQLRRIIDHLNDEEQLIRMKPGDELGAVLANESIVWSDFDTARVLSGLRRGAVSDHFLEKIVVDWRLDGVEPAIRTWDDLLDWADARAADLGVDINNPRMVAESKASISQLRSMIEHVAGKEIKTSEHTVFEAVFGFLRNLATSTHMPFAVFTTAIDGQQMAAKVIGREHSFIRGMGALNRGIVQNVRSWHPANMAKLRELLAGTQTLDPHARTRGFAMTGYDPAGARQTSTFSELNRQRGAAEIIGSVMLNMSRELAEFVTAGKIGERRVPVLAHMSLDGAIRGVRTVSMFSYNRWFYTRIGDVVEIDRLVRTNQVASPGEAIRTLRKQGKLQNRIDAADFALIKRDFDSDILETLGRRKQSGEEMVEFMGDQWYGGWSESSRAYRRHLDRIAMYEDTPDPTSATIPVASFNSELRKMVYQYFNYPQAHINQNVQTSRFRPVHAQAMIFSAMIGGAMFDLFVRDVVRYDWETAVDRFQHATRDDAATARYALRLIGRSGYIGMVEKIMDTVGTMLLGDRYEREYAVDMSVTPPALAYARDVLKTASLAHKIGGKKELTWGEKELLRRMSIVGNLPFVRFMRSRLMDPEMPPPRRATQAEATPAPPPQQRPGQVIEDALK